MSPSTRTFLVVVLVLGGLQVFVPPAARAQADVQAPSLEETVEGRLGRVPSGAVVGVYHEDELIFMRGWGTPSHETADSLTSRHLFPFPGFTDVLIAATVRALDAAGALDADAPIGRYVPALPAPLDRITLDQLLRHTAGLDDSEIPPEATLSEVVASLGPSSMLTAPGVVYSRSRYSYPLAARVLENATGLPIERVIASAILGPLDMSLSTFDRTEATRQGLAAGYVPTGDTLTARTEAEPRDRVDGLPVLYTNVAEVVGFLAAWMGGRMAGGPDALPPAPDFPEVEAPVVDGFRRGAHQLATELEQTLSGLGHGVVLRAYPETRSAIVAWANSQHGPTGSVDPFGASSLPRDAADYVAERLFGPDIPVRVTESLPDTAGRVSGADRVPLWAWAGRYVNGDRLVVLRPPRTEGMEAELVFFDGSRELPLERLVDGSVLARLPDDGRPALRFRLLRDPAGERYVFFGGKAYRLIEG